MNVYKKGLVAAVASTMVFAGAAGAPAFAQPTAATSSFTGTQQIPSDWTTGNLYINKFENATPGEAGNGEKLDTSELGRPMEGVKYTVIKLDGLDVHKNSDWQKFATFNTLNNKAALPDGVTEGTTTEVTTDANGLASAENLPLGFYKVVEEVPTDYTATSNPFYVALPMTNPSNRSQWMRDVYVYPKNQGPEDTSNPVKTVVDANKHAGEIIEYPVSQTLPNTADTRANGFKYYAIRDVVPQDRLELPAADNAASAVKDVKVGDTTLTAGTDYFVQPDKAGNPVVTFSKARVDQLKAGDKVEVNFQFRVKAVAGDENGTLGAVENKLETYPVPGNATNPPTPPTDTPPGDTPWEPPTDTPPDTPDHNPNSYFGNAFLTKKDAASKAAIAGAEFSVYGGACSTVDTTKEALKTATTNAEGRADFLGLHVNNFENDEAVGDTQETPKSYCLVETKAAEGYELLAQPIDFQVLVEGQDADGNGTVKAVNLTTDQSLTDNTRLNLPLTGGNGIWFVLAIGAILVAAGGAYSYAQRRNA